VILRALLASCLAFSLAACAGAAQQDATTTVPKPKPYIRKADPLPPDRVEDNRCTVDADCAAKRTCADVECRCVQDRCVQLAEPIDPVIDPAPAPPASV
jgi:hypothetical protein